ncbi:MAG: DUF512 domain-containing protein [Acidimicrobiales bacterium]|jgi:putative radical SAM enzyme (TIGR03279 family)|nr:DUF512 domain-containing protein [Acidimicrobiales bacterium]
MSLPVVVAVAPDSAAESAGLCPGDQIIAIDGEVPTDVIRWQLLVDEADPVLTIQRGGIEQDTKVLKVAGEPLGAEVDASIFDRVTTCDNHCEFCFIYQLPKGMRRSLYLKDDDYRLSFLYGNFTTLTRFTEADLERVVNERLSPLYVSIHATDPEVRTRMLRNRRGGYSLRWLKALLDFNIEIHGQVVVCPGINDGEVLDDTMLGILDRYAELRSLAVVPLGVSDHNREPSMRPHTKDEAIYVVHTVERWQERFLDAIGRRMVFAADEYYLLAGKPFPAADTYEDFPMHEDGIGIARAFEAGFAGKLLPGIGPRSGFFQWVDGAPAEGYRAPSNSSGSNRAGEISDPSSASGMEPVPVGISARKNLPIGILTGSYGAEVLSPLVDSLGRRDIRILEVENRFFGGNVKVSGLMVGADVRRVLSSEPEGHRYLLPDVCLNNGKFLDGLSPDDLTRDVEVVPTDGAALRAALGKGSGSLRAQQESSR